jgi:hypothetical protein
VWLMARNLEFFSSLRQAVLAARVLIRKSCIVVEWRIGADEVSEEGICRDVFFFCCRIIN